MPNTQLTFFKKKRNRALVALAFSFSLLIGAFILILVLGYTKNELIMTFYFIGLFAYVFIFINLRSKILVFSMHYYYYLMIEDDLDLMKPDRKLFTKSWLNKIENDGYKRSFEDKYLLMYYKFFKKTPISEGRGYTLVVLAIGKTDNYNFYNNTLDEEIERLYNTYEYERRVKRQVVIQFKKYDKFMEEHKDKLQEIVNYRNGDHYAINIPVGYFVKEDMTYFLRPEHKYYNKMHFEATKLAFKYSNVEGGNEDGEEKE